MERAKLLIASANAGKVAEYRSLLDGVPCDLVSLADAQIRGDVQETGETYDENARLKAVVCAERSGLVTLADDSGLEVEALGEFDGLALGAARGDAERLDLPAGVRLRPVDVPGDEVAGERVEIGRHRVGVRGARGEGEREREGAEQHRPALHPAPADPRKGRHGQTRLPKCHRPDCVSRAVQGVSLPL